MKNWDYTLTDGTLEIKAHKQVTVRLYRDISFKNIIVNTGASLGFIGDYKITIPKEGKLLYG